MKKENALEILQDIQKSLNGENAKERGLKTIETYRKGIEIAENQKIKKLIKKQNEYSKKEGKNERKIISISKKIDKEIKRIYNS